MRVVNKQREKLRSGLRNAILEMYRVGPVPKMIKGIDWSKVRPQRELADTEKALIREITERFLSQGEGTPDVDKRIELGRDRHHLNQLQQLGLLRNVSNEYYPTFEALSFAPPTPRSICENAVESALRAAQYLYKTKRFGPYKLNDLLLAAHAVCPSPITLGELQVGAQFLRDFPIYFVNFENSADVPVTAVHVTENILDFESLAQAWDDQMAQRQPVAPPAIEAREAPQGASPAVAAGQLRAPDLQPGDASKRVFVIHGRDERLRAGIFTFLRAIGLEPLEWTKAMQLTGKASPYIGEILEAAFKYARAAVVLLTPDDEARLRKDLINSTDPPEERALTGQARPNVLFEAGMAFASHPNQTVLVQIGSVRPFSDIAGRHIARMDNSIGKRQELALKLKTARCSVELEGTDWHTLGDLTPLAQETSPPPSPPTEAEPGNPSPPASLRKLSDISRVIIAPVSRSTRHAEYTLEKVDEFGALIRLSNGVNVRIPKADYVESWDDWLSKPKLILTRKYFQGYFPGHEAAEEYFLPR